MSNELNSTQAVRKPLVWSKRIIIPLEQRGWEERSNKLDSAEAVHKPSIWSNCIIIPLEWQSGEE